MLLMLMLVAALQTDAAMPKTWGPPVNGLRMGIYPVTSGDLPSTGAEFYVAFQNVGDSDFSLNLGYMMKMGKLMEPFFIQLIVTDATGQTRRLQQVSPRPGEHHVSGRFDDFVVGLGVGSTYTLRIRVDTYWDLANKKEIPIRWNVGRHRIQARFDGRGDRDSSSLAPLNFWKGSAESNVLEFAVSNAGTPKDQPERPKS